MSKKAEKELKGELQVSPKQARNLKSKAKIGKQSPYVEIFLNKPMNRQKTKNDKRGHIMPCWNDLLRFDVYKGDEEFLLNVKVLYTNSINQITKHLGQCTIDLKNITKKREADDWHQLYLEDVNTKCGEIYLEITYYPVNEARTISQSTLSKRMDINKLMQKEIENESNLSKTVQDLQSDKMEILKDLIKENNMNGFVKELDDIFVQPSDTTDKELNRAQTSKQRPLPKIPPLGKGKETGEVIPPRRRTLPFPPSANMANNRGLPGTQPKHELNFYINKNKTTDQITKNKYVQRNKSIPNRDEINAVFEEIMGQTEMEDA